MKVKARISKTNKFREITLRKNPENLGDKYLDEEYFYKNVPAYMNVGRTTVSGTAYEFRDMENWIFRPHGKNAGLI